MMQSALCLAPVAGPAAPAGLACLENGGLLIADPLGHRLWGWHPGRLPVSVAGTGTRGDRGEGAQAQLAELAAPCVVRLDGLGRATVLERDAAGSRVRRIETDGRLVTLYRSPAHREVLDLAVSPDGTIYLVLQELARGGGTWAAQLGTFGRLFAVYGGEGAPGEPDMAIGAGPDGSLYLLHGGALWRREPNGSVRLVVRDSRIALSCYDASCLAVLPGGRVVMTFAEAGRVMAWEPETERLVAIAEADPWVCRCREACVHAPAYPAADARGNVWAVDGLRRRVVRLGAAW
jgi:hypothetical protein